MNNEDKILFKKALSDAFLRKYERELSQCQENASCSKNHLKNIKRIINHGMRNDKCTPSFKKRTIVWLLIAAALLLAGCTAYTYRRHICKFVEELWPKHMMVTHDIGCELSPSREIIDFYQATYVPEGYTPTYEKISSVHAMYEWRNSDDESLIFEQCIISGTYYVLEIESGDTVVKKLGDHVIYFRSADTFSYIWSDGTYSFQLISSVQLDDDIIIRIVEGLRVSKLS